MLRVEGLVNLISSNFEELYNFSDKQREFEFNK